MASRDGLHSAIHIKYHGLFMPFQLKKPPLTLASAIVIAALLLSACSSKPESADIKKYVVPTYQCGMFVIKDVKKVDGAARTDNLYDVTFSFIAEIEGGPQGVAAQIADPQGAQIKLMGECSRMHLMWFSYWSMAVAGAPSRPPYGLVMQGVGVMKKAESGWVFQSEPNLTIEDFVFGDAITAPAPAPVAAPVAVVEAESLTTSREGNWQGEIRCGPLTTNPAKRPAFSGSISMIVAGNKATLTRETERALDRADGLISTEGRVSMVGEGHFKVGDDLPWVTKVSGTFSGATFSGTGGLFSAQGAKLRDCNVQLGRLVGGLKK